MWQRDLRAARENDRVCEAVVESLEEFVRQDRYLLQVDASERAMAHRLAVYLERLLPEWNVDCEYNRDGHHAKSIRYEHADLGNDELGSRVYPDIIVHARGTNQNLLAVELKKSTNPLDDGFDIQKLTAYRRELGYQAALFVRFGVNREGHEILDARFVD